MKFKIKFKCDICKKNYYNEIEAKNRKSATKYKKLFKNSNGIIHQIIVGGCEGSETTNE